MIIDKSSQKMLDTLIASNPDYPRGTFSFDYICEISGLGEDDMFPIVKGLVDQKLAEYATFSSGMNMGIVLTQRGRKCKELQGLETRERWKERIYGFVSGVLISVVGGLILLLLQR